MKDVEADMAEYLQQIRRQLGAGKDLCYVTVNKDVNLLEIPEVIRLSRLLLNTVLNVLPLAAKTLSICLMDWRVLYNCSMWVQTCSGIIRPEGLQLAAPSCILSWLKATTQQSIPAVTLAK